MSLQILRRTMGLCLVMSFSPAIHAEIHPYLGAGLSASIQHIQNNNPQINYYSGRFNDAYPLDQANSTTANFSLQSGIVLDEANNPAKFSFGMGLYQTLSDHNFQGQLIETALGDNGSALYNYKFNITDTRLMAEGQFAWTIQRFTPFINVGVGPAWIEMKNYRETAVDTIGYVGLPGFGSNRKTNLAYQVGLGIGYAFNFSSNFSKKLTNVNVQHELISLGYRYVNLGNVAFNTRDSSYPYNLKLGRLTNNEVYLSYTHMFM